ncbi:MAG: PAS domain S-box protein [Bryobacteraceae bacterium]
MAIYPDHNAEPPQLAGESPEFLAQLLNAVQHSIIAVDRDERVTYWNEYATQFYGFSREQALGQ